MHTSSLAHMARLVAAYLTEARDLDVLDIGSQDVNGSYRPLFDKQGWRYRGVDMIAGRNVDIVMRNPYELPLASKSVDLVISGQAFEHIDYFWITFLDMVRVLRPNGKIFLIAPSRGHEHRYPVDCWRFYPDGYRALARFGRIELVEVSTDWEANAAEDSAVWGDTVGVFRNPAQGRWSSLGRELTLHALRAWARGGRAG